MKLSKWFSLRIDDETLEKYQQLSREKKFWILVKVRKFLRKLLGMSEKP
jgi:hypothetical protein